MIDYVKLKKCLEQIVLECKEGDDYKDIIDDVLINAQLGLELLMRGKLEEPKVDYSKSNLGIGTLMQLSHPLDNWLLCDGRSLLIKDYPELFAIIEYFYTPRDKQGRDIFCIPDFLGEMYYIKYINHEEHNVIEETKAKYKYQIGDKVYAGNKKILEFIIIGYDNGSYLVKDNKKEWSIRFLESDLYPTKQALIEAQLEYWRDMLCDELEQHVSDYCTPFSKCQHESDGIRYSSCCEGVTEFKCKKCGEFYR